MGLHQELGDFKTQYEGMSRGEFLGKFSVPFLVVQFGGAGEKLPDHGEPGKGIPKWDRTSWDTKDLKGGLQAIVAQLTKSDRNDEKDVIVLGRVEECDVVIPHPSISKRHLLFHIDTENGDVTVEEAGSTYGTLLDGEPLIKGSTVLLENQATFIIAGSALASFFTPESLFDFFQPTENPD